MKTLLIGAAGVSLLWTMLPATQPASLLPSSVKIETAVSWGSGTAIGYADILGARHTVILTAHHVVGEAMKVHYGAEVWEAKTLADDEEDDLALIEITHEIPVASLGGDTTLGEEVWVVGFPLAQGQAITHGYVSQYMGKLLEATASVYPGNSGGGLFVQRWGGYKLVGVVDMVAMTGNMFASSPASTIEYSVPVSKVKAFINAHYGGYP